MAASVPAHITPSSGECWLYGSKCPSSYYSQFRWVLAVWQQVSQFILLPVQVSAGCMKASVSVHITPSSGECWLYLYGSKCLSSYYSQFRWVVAVWQQVSQFILLPVQGSWPVLYKNDLWSLISIYYWNIDALSKRYIGILRWNYFLCMWMLYEDDLIMKSKMKTNWSVCSEFSLDLECRSADLENLPLKFVRDTDEVLRHAALELSSPPGTGAILIARYRNYPHH